MPHRPRVCQLTHGLHVGGAELLAARIARRLSDRFEFVFACLEEPGDVGERLIAEGFEVFSLRRRPGVDWRCAVKLANWLRERRIRAINAHQYTPFFYALAARLLYRRPGILFTEHGRHFPDYPRRKRIVTNRLLLRRRDRVVAVGEAVRQAVIHNEGIPARRVEVVYNGVDLAAYDSNRFDREGVRRELGIRPDQVAVFQVARLDPLKDHLTAVGAMARLREQAPEVRLFLAGDGPERGAIEDRVRREGLEGSVTFLGTRKDVPRLLSAADVLLLTSISEGIPLTLIEGMAARLPIVATDVGGVAEVVLPGRTGLLAPARDEAGLAAHLLRLAREPELRRELGRRGRERAEAQFSEERMLDAYAKVYEALLRNARRTLAPV